MFVLLPVFGKRVVHPLTSVLRQMCIYMIRPGFWQTCKAEDQPWRRHELCGHFVCLLWVFFFYFASTVHTQSEVVEQGDSWGTYSTPSPLHMTSAVALSTWQSASISPSFSCFTTQLSCHTWVDIFLTPLHCSPQTGGLNPRQSTILPCSNTLAMCAPTSFGAETKPFIFISSVPCTRLIGKYSVNAYGP